MSDDRETAICPGCRQARGGLGSSCRVFELRVGGDLHDRMPLPEGAPSDVSTPAPCPECGTGRIHHVGCTREPCPRCLAPILSCPCPVSWTSARRERRAEALAASATSVVAVSAFLTWRASASAAFLALAAVSGVLALVMAELALFPEWAVSFAGYEERSWLNGLILLGGLVVTVVAVSRAATSSRPVALGAGEVAVATAMAAGIGFVRVACRRLDPPHEGTNYDWGHRDLLDVVAFGVVVVLTATLVAFATTPARVDVYGVVAALLALVSLFFLRSSGHRG